MLKILRIKEAVGLESMSVRQKLKHGGMVGVASVEPDGERL